MTEEIDKWRERPPELKADNAGEESNEDWLDACRERIINTIFTAPKAAWENVSARRILDIERRFRRIRRKTRFDLRYWCYFIHFRALILRHIALSKVAVAMCH
jgi:hypothetical protein